MELSDRRCLSKLFGMRALDGARAFLRELICEDICLKLGPVHGKRDELVVFGSVSRALPTLGELLKRKSNFAECHHSQIKVGSFETDSRNDRSRYDMGTSV